MISQDINRPFIPIFIKILLKNQKGSHPVHDILKFTDNVPTCRYKLETKLNASKNESEWKKKFLLIFKSTKDTIKLSGKTQLHRQRPCIKLNLLVHIFEDHSGEDQKCFNSDGLNSQDILHLNLSKGQIKLVFNLHVVLGQRWVFKTGLNVITCNVASTTVKRQLKSKTVCYLQRILIM